VYNDLEGDGMAFLRVRDVTKTFGERVILSDVSFDAARGETVAILGPSGSGKSTLLSILGGLLPPDQGEVLVGDTEVTDLLTTDLCRYRSRTVGFVFQDHYLLPQLTLLENVLLPALAVGQPPDPKRAEQLLGRVGLSERMHAYPYQVSGGERQRAALARALMNRPPLLLCDEPTGNLDQKNGSTIVDLLLQTAAPDSPDGDGVLVVMVTHNVEHAGRFDRRMRLQDGQIVESE